MTDSYLMRCAQAAVQQGLGDVAAALAATGTAFTIDQTGGFTMVLHVPLASGHVLGVIEDGGGIEGAPPYLAVEYPSSAVAHGEEEFEGEMPTFDFHLDEVVAYAIRHR